MTRQPRGEVIAAARVAPGRLRVFAGVVAARARVLARRAAAPRWEECPSWDAQGEVRPTWDAAVDRPE